MEESPYAPYGELVGAASVAAAGGFVTNSNNYRVVSAPVATAVYDVTLDQPIDAANAGVIVGCRSAAAIIYSVTRPSDTVVRVASFNAAGAATASTFDIVVFRKGMN